MRHTLVGWAYSGTIGDAPPRPFARHPRRSHRCRIPAGVEVTNAITRIGAARFDSAGEHPALSRGWRPIAEDRDRESARGHDHNRVCLRATPAEFSAQPRNNDSPRLGHFRTSALIQAEIAAQYGSITSSFVAPAGTKCGPASRCSKRSRSGTKARAGPASVETSGLAERLQP